jgi:hypothetical protein
MKILAIILGTVIGLPITFYVRKAFTFTWRSLSSAGDVAVYDITQTGFAKMVRAGIFYFVGIAFFIGLFAQLFGVSFE